MSIRNPLISRISTVLFKETVTPIRGSVVYRKLGPAEHTGIYVGDRTICELDGSGRIELVDYREFCNSNPFCEIYVACNKSGHVLSSAVVYKRAMKMVGNKRKYNLILDNCHQFASGCLTGEFESPDNFFVFLEQTIEDKYGSSLEWRAIDSSW